MKNVQPATEHAAHAACRRRSAGVLSASRSAQRATASRRDGWESASAARARLYRRSAGADNRFKPQRRALMTTGGAAGLRGHGSRQPPARLARHAQPRSTPQLTPLGFNAREPRLWGPGTEIVVRLAIGVALLSRTRAGETAGHRCCRCANRDAVAPVAVDSGGGLVGGGAGPFGGRVEG